MKKTLFLIFLLFNSFTQAQNLVLNYSFENKLKCIKSDGQFTGYIEYWTGGGGGGPSYFTQCPGNTITNVPLSLFGYQNAHTGISYAGIYTFIKTVLNDRCYIQDSLTSSLVAGTKYFVTFYVSLANNYKYACNNIGAYLSDSTLNYSGTQVKSYLTPQVTNDTLHNPLTDTVTWIKVTGGFVAKGGGGNLLL